jgi:hypothetical protein
MVNREQKVAVLFDDVSGVIKKYGAKWQKTGEKYNIFKVASIQRQAQKEAGMT